MSGILSALATLFVWFMGLFKKSAADKVASTDHAILEDAVNRPDASSESERLRSGKFGRS